MQNEFYYILPFESSDDEEELKETDGGGDGSVVAAAGAEAGAGAGASAGARGRDNGGGGSGGGIGGSGGGGDSGVGDDGGGEEGGDEVAEEVVEEGERELDEVDKGGGVIDDDVVSVGGDVSSVGDFGCVGGVSRVREGVVGVDSGVGDCAHNAPEEMEEEMNAEMTTLKVRKHSLEMN
eukprot:6183237-Pleurochrysis_carterae.AAC.2